MKNIKKAIRKWLGLRDTHNINAINLKYDLRDVSYLPVSGDISSRMEGDLVRIDGRDYIVVNIGLIVTTTKGENTHAC